MEILKENLEKGYLVAKVDATDKFGVLREMGNVLVEKELVKDTYPGAVICVKVGRGRPAGRTQGGDLSAHKRKNTDILRKGKMSVKPGGAAMLHAAFTNAQHHTS